MRLPLCPLLRHAEDKLASTKWESVTKRAPICCWEGLKHLEGRLLWAYQHRMRSWRIPSVSASQGMGTEPPPWRGVRLRQQGAGGVPVTLEVEGPVPVLPVAGVLPVPEVAGVDTPGADGGRPAPAPAWVPVQAFRQRLGC